MKLKKLLVFLAITTTTSLLFFGATACTKPHEHSYSEWQVVAQSTCTHYGLQKKSCECGSVEYGILEILPHTEVTDAGFDATCTEFGKTEGSHCGICGITIKSQELIAPIGHNFDQVELLENATCDKDGLNKISCSNDGCDCYYNESFSLPELNGDEIFSIAKQYTGLVQFYDKIGSILSEASAFLINANGDIVVSNLKLDNASSATFYINETYYDVTDVLAYSTKSNIAVLRTNAINLPYATICETQPMNAETVYIVGFSDFVNASISKGVVSNPKCTLDEADYIQHDTSMTSGYMGGPLLNRFGEVIGINVGVYTDSNLNLSTCITELDKLDNSTPITIEEYGDLTYTPSEKLDYWTQTNYTATNDTAVAHIIYDNNFTYALGFNVKNGYSFAEGGWQLDEKHQVSVEIIFDNSEGTYKYNASYTDSIWKNETHGFIDAETYDQKTILTYDTYYGRYWKESKLMTLYSSAVYDTLEWFDACLNAYFYDLSLESFGFTNLKYDRDEKALDKLNAFITDNGTLNGQTGEYLLTDSTQFNEDVLNFNVTYTPETQTSDFATVVTVYYYTADGRLFNVAINLNPAENGMRFDFSYAESNGSDYVTKNIAWGYLDATFFTNATKLDCFVFDGMNEYEDALLVDYTAFLSYVLGLLNDSVMPSVSPELTVKDLGFLFYFG